jgi:hypothetical protein
MAYMYVDGELIDLPDVKGLGSVQPGGLVQLLRENGDVIGLASLGGGGFVTVGETPVVLQLEDDEEEDEASPFDGVH